MRRSVDRLAPGLALTLALFAGTAAAADAAALDAEHCAACHGADRLGGTGPALLPESLGRLKPDATKAVIAGGRAATQMPGFGQVLDEDGIKALAAYVHAPLAGVPDWGMAEIEASRTVLAAPEGLARRQCTTPIP